MRTFKLANYMNLQEKINILRIRNNRECSIHTHEFAEFIFIVRGTCRHCIDGTDYDTEAGDLLFVNYGQTHSFQDATDDYEYYNLLYLPDFFSEELMNTENIYEIFRISLFREFARKEPGQPQIVSFRGKEYLETKKLIEDMMEEFTEKKTGYCSVLNGYSRVLLSKVLRKLEVREPKAEAQKYMNRITADCLAYIDARCLEKITLKEIAEHTFYNPSYFSRIFKEHCGISLSEYIKEKRIKEAARLLANTDLTNDEIMSRVGYTDKKQFYKNFREIYHETPAQYRKMPTKK